MEMEKQMSDKQIWRQWDPEWNFNRPLVLHTPHTESVLQCPVMMAPLLDRSSTGILSGS